MDQVRALISGLLNGGARPARWGWTGSRWSAWQIWSAAVAIGGLAALFRRPVPVPVRGRRRGRLG